MLDKFRIEAEVLVLDMSEAPPSEETQKHFEERGCIVDTNNALTMMNLKLGEYIHQNSSSACLIVVTIPIPQAVDTQDVSEEDSRDIDLIDLSKQYMSWLEMLSSGLTPPVLLIRGNQENVITIYS
eukprot:TRINITY_DN474_c0_g1_i4.p1 TRINITY_DN474_c0_g1~~TRINITY_DN474_c0_g1_i4.p1  ORF type:complete len:126 (-),score=18.09 TRINITY_DN474_c0_g1_i4:14-391(-)